MKFDFDGLDTLLMELERAKHNMEQAKSEALLAGAEVMQEETKKAARRRTGNLILNIEISKVLNENVFVYVDNQGKAYYGHMLENGTSKMAAKPFMGPTFNRKKFMINRAMANKMRERLGWGF